MGTHMLIMFDTGAHGMCKTSCTRNSREQGRGCPRLGGEGGGGRDVQMLHDHLQQRGLRVDIDERKKRNMATFRLCVERSLGCT